MKQQIEQILGLALEKLHEQGLLSSVPSYINVDNTKDKQHGDFATNIALVLAKTMQKKPREVAELIVAALPTSPHVLKTEIAGPGFINFFLTPLAVNAVIAQILTEQDKFGRSKVGRGKRILVEFVSSNPTGPLHVGHGRHAAFGSVLCNLLAAVGFKCYREYYVNDAGRQMDILAVSVWFRYLQSLHLKLPFPANGYQGEYVTEIAHALINEYSDLFVASKQAILDGLPADETDGGDKEIYIDAVIEKAKLLLGNKYLSLFDYALTEIVQNIKDDLAEFGVEFDNWFSEREFVQTGVVDTLLDKLINSGYAYEKDAAIWFKSSVLGDEKDRVLVRSNGVKTYFANDVAYHINKFERGFDIAIDIFGSDHHGYVPRMKAAMQAAQINPERLQHLLVQFVSLYRGGQPVAMSTRGGNFVTLRELRDEVGNDAARLFYVMRKYEQHMDFDLDLAKSQSNENPVFYLQYAHARICSLLRQLNEKGLSFDESLGLAESALLVESQEKHLLMILARYPEIIMNAALQYEPHVLTNYLREVAGAFHSYYNSHQFIVDDAALRNARLALVAATKQILLNGFELLGISAPESM